MKTPARCGAILVVMVDTHQPSGVRTCRRSRSARGARGQALAGAAGSPWVASAGVADEAARISGGRVAAVAGLGGGPTFLGRRNERQVRELSAAAVPAAPGQRLGQQRLIWSVPTVRPLAALTFDDGPDPELTPRILKVLAEHGVQATFVEPLSGALVLVGPAIIGQPASRGVGDPFLIYHRGRAVFAQNNSLATITGKTVDICAALS